jgi:uncharacterized cupin superfamily protein
VVPEAPLEHTEHGLVPAGEGWFVLNARDAQWFESYGLGAYVTFEGANARFAQFGINVAVLRPGEPNCMYHAEGAQEDFLVLAGECLLIVEGEERPLRAWDFVHCPAETEHVFVGAGDGPCLLLGVGARTQGRSLVYPVNDVALKHGAGVQEQTSEGSEAYAGYRMPGPAQRPAEFDALVG